MLTVSFLFDEFVRYDCVNIFRISRKLSIRLIVYYTVSKNTKIKGGNTFTVLTTDFDACQN